MREKRIHKKKVMNFKKKVSLFVFAVLCFVGTAIFAFADAKFEYVAYPDKTTIKRGDTLTVNVRGRNVPNNAATFASSIQYDGDSFRFISNGRDGSFIESFDKPSDGSDSKATGAISGGNGEVSYTYGNGTEETPVPKLEYDSDFFENGELRIYTMVFKVRDDAKPGKHVFTPLNPKYDDINKDPQKVDFASFTINVDVPVDKDSIKLSSDLYTANVGDTDEKIIVDYNHDTSDKINLSFTSNDEKVVKVKDDGTLIPVGKGKTTVKVVAFGKELTANVEITNNATGITLDKNDITIKKGDENKKQLTATVTPTGADGTVEWKSKNDKIARVDENGYVTGVAGGDTVITATIGKFEASCTVHVGVPLESITLNSSDFTLTKGKDESKQLSVSSISPSDATGVKDSNGNVIVTWTSDNEKVATVDNTGIVKLVGKGTTKITASIGEGDNKKTKSVNVTVKVPITSFTSNISSTSNFYPGNTITPVTTITPSEDVTSDDTTITWNSDDEKVATVDSNGKITAVAPGKAKVTGKLKNGKSVTIDVTVLTPISSISLTVANGTKIDRGSSQDIGITTVPEKVDQSKDVTWSSTDSSIATVENGKLVAKKIGKTTITAKLNVNPSITASSEVEVVAYLKDIKITNLNKDGSEELNKGEEFTPKLSFNPGDTTDSKDVVWSTPDTNVVDLDSKTGKVKAIGAGKATITGTNAKKTITYVVNVVVPISEINIDKSDLKDLHKEETYQIKATVGPKDTTETNKTISYESSDSNIASVNEKGVVTAKKGGKVTITLTAGKNKVTNKIDINVVVPITSFKLNKDKTTINRKSSETLSGVIEPEDTTESTDITWSSLNDKIATVDKNGKVTGVSEGTTTIIGTLENGMTARTEVTVKIIPIKSMKLESMSVIAGDSILANDYLELNPTNVTETEGMIYESNDNNIATVDENGNIVGVSEGTATITVTSKNGKKASNTVTVKNALNAKFVTKEDNILTYLDKNTFKGAETKDDVKSVRLYVSFDKNISQSDKDLITSKMNDNEKLVNFLNVKVLLLDKDKNIIGYADELSHKVSIEVEIPSEFIRSGRIFHIIRLHDGKIDRVEDTDHSDSTITFESDKFSSYAIVYEQEKEAIRTADDNTSNNPHTSDDIFKYIFGLLSSLVVITGGAYFLKKAK